jgi:hypothetical protein
MGVPSTSVLLLCFDVNCDGVRFEIKNPLPQPYYTGGNDSMANRREQSHVRPKQYDEINTQLPVFVIDSTRADIRVDIGHDWCSQESERQRQSLCQLTRGVG